MCHYQWSWLLSPWQKGPLILTDNPTYASQTGSTTILGFQVYSISAGDFIPYFATSVPYLPSSWFCSLSIQLVSKSQKKIYYFPISIGKPWPDSWTSFPEVSFKIPQFNFNYLSHFKYHPLHWLFLYFFNHAHGSHILKNCHLILLSHLSSFVSFSFDSFFFLSVMVCTPCLFLITHSLTPV